MMTQAPLTTQPPPAGAAASQVVIKCTGLQKTFRDFWMRPRVKAVDGIDLEVLRGEVFGLLGPNGSGKSTTIKMLLGLLHPTAGRIAVFGRHPRDVAIKEQIGYLPEESYLYKFLSARETLEYYGRLFHQHSRQRNMRIDTLLEMVGLERVARRPVGEFSKGMQRRIGLAQALINDPQLLILDEPTTGMDPIGTRQIKDLIRELARRGKTILLCSHLLADVEDVCDRVSIMFGGKIRREGTVNELLERSEMTTLQIPQVDDQTLQEIEAVLERRGQHIDKVERPRQRLETLFLNIVEQAQKEGLTTSGASAGGQIAAFLRGQGEQPDAAEGEAVIEELLSGAERVEPQHEAEHAPAAAPEQPPPSREAAPASESVLQELISGEAQQRAAQSDAAGEPPKPSPPFSPDRNRDADVDTGVIDSLLGDEQTQHDEDQTRDDAGDERK